MAKIKLKHITRFLNRVEAAKSDPLVVALVQKQLRGEEMTDDDLAAIAAVGKHKVIRLFRFEKGRIPQAFRQKIAQINKTADVPIKLPKREARKRKKVVVRHSEEYITYLHSEEWRAKRSELVIESSRCGICGCAATWENPLDLHHLTYDRFGAELAADLEIICRKHHEMIHRLTRRGIHVGAATERIRAEFHTNQ